MVKFSGHTMGTPELDLYGAMKLFKELGFNGIEIRCAPDGHIDTSTITLEEIYKIKRWSKDLDLKIACLTPYFRDFVTSAREKELAEMKRVIEIAHELECPNVRALGGFLPAPKGCSASQIWKATVEALRELGAFAQPLGVQLCIETHDGSLTLTAHQVRQMVDDIDMENVGILFDFSWIHWAGEESPEEAVTLCMPKIFHCHCKDWQINRTIGERQVRLMGEGNIPWKRVFRALQEAGYAGYLSDEYEKYWHPEELPAPQEGMKKDLEYMQRFWSL